MTLGLGASYFVSIIYFDNLKAALYSMIAGGFIYVFNRAVNTGLVMPEEKEFGVIPTAYTFLLYLILVFDGVYLASAALGREIEWLLIAMGFQLGWLIEYSVDIMNKNRSP